MTGNSVAEFTSKVILREAENGAAREAATWTGGPEVERTRSERIKSRCGTVRQFRGVLRLRFASLRMTPRS
jgi:hypothetical protein